MIPKRIDTPPDSRDLPGEFGHRVDVDVRFADTDAMGHVNNVTYYAYFDTAVNQYLIEQGGFDIARSQAVGVVVETMCRFFRSVAFPDRLEVGLRVTRLGRSSIRYEIGVFKEGMVEIAAQGHFVHVYVKRETTDVCGSSRLDV